MSSKIILHFFIITLFCISSIVSAPADVRIFMEARCNFCKNLIATKFTDFTQNVDHAKIATVSFYPFGNAIETDNNNGTYSYQCQHGPLECRGNLIENCALHYFGEDIEAKYKFMICLEAAGTALNNDFDAALAQCVEDVDLRNNITTCADGLLGNQLEHQAALATPSQKRYVPYITVNGVHQEDAEDDLLYYLCGLDDYSSLDGCKPYNSVKFLEKDDDLGY